MRYVIGMNVPQIIPLVLTALLSAVPVALPATFTLAAALGAQDAGDEGRAADAADSPCTRRP